MGPVCMGCVGALSHPVRHAANDARSSNPLLPSRRWPPSRLLSNVLIGAAFSLRHLRLAMCGRRYRSGGAASVIVGQVSAGRPALDPIRPPTVRSRRLPASHRLNLGDAGFGPLAVRRVHQRRKANGYRFVVILGHVIERTYRVLPHAPSVHRFDSVRARHRAHSLSLGRRRNLPNRSISVSPAVMTKH